MCLGDIVEGEDCHTQAGEEVASEDDKRVEWELGGYRSVFLPWTHSKTELGTGGLTGWVTYNRNDFSLDSLVQGNESKEKGKVELMDCQ